MKKQSIFLLATAMFSATLFSCANEDIASNASNGNNGEEVNKGNRVTFRASLPQATDGTRISLSDPNDGTGIKCVWATGDNISVTNRKQDGTVSTTIFELKSGIGTNDATFEGYPSDGYSEGDELYAYYPSTLSVNSNGVTNIAYHQSQTNPSLEDRNSKSTMYATSYYKENGQANLVFKQLTSMLRINVNVGVAAKINAVELYGDNLTTIADYTVAKPGTPGTWARNSYSDNFIKNQVSFTSNLDTDANGKLSSPVYMLVIPQTLEKGFRLAVVDDNKKYYVYNVDSKVQFVQGKVHEINVADKVLPQGNIATDYYMWDAKEEYPIGLANYTADLCGPRWCNTEAYQNNWNTDNVATAQEIASYMKAGCYYVTNGPETTFTYSLTGTKQSTKCGVYFLKKDNITNFGEENLTLSNYADKIAKSESGWNSLSQAEKDKYFFVPLIAGFSNGSLVNYGQIATFWTQSIVNGSGDDLVYVLSIDNTGRVKLTQSARNFGLKIFITQ